eukprot:TRINITY_DN3818_c0_g1_i1.p1 TRINITY_DN3818_c0_g1~~TRINITY_DN3818_c0_g1_i1.p1  ORF type:complete len:182 (-),score=38.05 TRINITY_DN3818_c0_g1_i1:194-739(-)
MRAMAKSIVMGMFAIHGVVEGSFSNRVTFPDDYTLQELDVNGDGKVTFSDLKEWFQHRGLNIQDDELTLNEKALLAGDLDKNGGIDLWNENEVAAWDRATESTFEEKPPADDDDGEVPEESSKTVFADQEPNTPAMVEVPDGSPETKEKSNETEPYANDEPDESMVKEEVTTESADTTAVL